MKRHESHSESHEWVGKLGKQARKFAEAGSLRCDEGCLMKYASVWQGMMFDEG